MRVRCRPRWVTCCSKRAGAVAADTTDIDFRHPSAGRGPPRPRSSLPTRRTMNAYPQVQYVRATLEQRVVHHHCNNVPACGFSCLPASVRLLRRPNLCPIQSKPGRLVKCAARLRARHAASPWSTLRWYLAASGAWDQSHAHDYITILCCRCRSPLRATPRARGDVVVRNREREWRRRACSDSARPPAPPPPPSSLSSPPAPPHHRTRRRGIPRPSPRRPAGHRTGRIASSRPATGTRARGLAAAARRRQRARVAGRYAASASA